MRTLIILLFFFSSVSFAEQAEFVQTPYKEPKVMFEFYFDEPNKRGAPGVIGAHLDKKKFRKMIDEFYTHHGWDEQGVPTDETLQRLGLDNEPSHQL